MNERTTQIMKIHTEVIKACGLEFARSILRDCANSALRNNAMSEYGSISYVLDRIDYLDTRSLLTALRTAKAWNTTIIFTGYSWVVINS